VNFTENFESSTASSSSSSTQQEQDVFPFRAVHTQKQSHVYVLVEQGRFLLGIALNKKRCSDYEYCIHIPSIRSILITAYRMFKLFFGTFTDLFRHNVETFRDRMDYFFSRYLSQLRLYQMPLVNLFSGVEFLPMENVSLLRVETLIAQLQRAFPSISKLLFLYQDRLLWYTVQKSDVAVLFRYLTHNLLPMSLRAELHPSHLNKSAGFLHHAGKFITGTASSSPSDNPLASVKLPVVFLSSEDEDETSKPLPYHLVVYRALNATVCLFMRKVVSGNLLSELDGYLGPELSTLASSLGDSYGVHANGLKAETDFHFIYYNPASLSLKTSFYEQSEQPNAFASPQLPPVPQQIIKLTCDICDEFLSSSDEFGEVYSKTETEWWVVAKKAPKRLLFLLLPNRTQSTLIDVQERVAGIVKTHFDNIFVT